MHVEWYGQSAFRLTDDRATVVIDPFGDMSALGTRGLRWDYPAIEGLSADLVLVTHEHRDHNGVEAVGGEPAILRSTAGTHESPIGEVVGIASEHDDVAGTQRGPNTIFAFDLDGIRVAHLGDFGQPGLRPEQEAALQGTDLLFVPVGGGPTIDAKQAAAVVRAVKPRWAVPMHYRTPRIGFLETEQEFLSLLPRVERLDQPAFETGDLPGGDDTLVVVPAAP